MERTNLTPRSMREVQAAEAGLAWKGGALGGQPGERLVNVLVESTKLTDAQQTICWAR